MPSTPINNATSLLPAATVSEAPNGELPKKSALITVNIEPLKGNPNDGIILDVRGTYLDGRPYYWRLPLRPTGSGPIIFRLINGRDIDIPSLENIDISYEVITQQGTIVPSETLHLKVVSGLPHVEIVEAPAPDFEFDPSQSPFDATIIVPANPAFIVGSSVWLHVKGSAAGGSDDQEFPITNIWVGKDLTFTVKRAIILANLNGTAIIYYALVDGQETSISDEVVMWVGPQLKTPVLEILEGTPVDATTTAVDPMKVLESGTFTLRVSTPDMLDTDKIGPYFKGASGLGTPLIPSKNGDADKGLVEFGLDINVIAANLGKKCKTGYKYTRGSRSKLSDVLQVEVQPLPTSAMDLVKVSGTVGGELDPRDSHTVQISKFPFMRPGLAVWILLVVNQDECTLRDGVPVSQSEFDAKRVEQLIPEDYLLTLSHGEVIKVFASVSLNGTGQISSAVPFVVREYRITREPKIVATIPVGNTPSRLAISIDGKQAYVPNLEGGSVSVIDTASNTVIHTITGLRRPPAVAAHPDGRHLYVTELAFEAINIFSTTSYEFIERFEAFRTVENFIFNTNGSRFYAASSDDLRTYDSRTGAVLAHSDADTSDMASGPGDTHLYSVHSTSEEVLALDSTDLRITKRIPASASRAIALTRNNVNGPYLYCGLLDLVIIDPTTNTVHGKLILNESISDIVMHPRKALAYVAASSGLLVIDTNTHEVIHHLHVGQLSYIAITPDGSRAYITREHANIVTVVDL